MALLALGDAYKPLAQPDAATGTIVAQTSRRIAHRMPVLTAVLPPSFLIWVTAAVPQLIKDPKVLKKVLSALVFSKIDNYAYFEDATRNLAEAIVSTFTGTPLEPTALPSFSQTSRVPLQVDEQQYDALRHHIASKIVINPFDSIVLAQFAWVLGWDAWRRLTFIDEPPGPDHSPETILRFSKMFGPDGFAKSCTYKSSGDFVVHSILQAAHIASWRVSALVVGENVYGPCAAVHGSMANSVIRQYTDNAPSELLLPRRNTTEGIKFIVMAATVLEASNDKTCRLVIDRDILKRDNKHVPRLAYTNDAPPYDGRARFGYVQDNSFYTFKTAQSAILAFLKACCEHKVETITPLHYAMVSPEKLPMSSLLRKFVA